MNKPKIPQTTKNSKEWTVRWFVVGYPEIELTALKIGANK